MIEMSWSDTLKKSKEEEMAERDFQTFVKEKQELLEMLKEVEKKIVRVFNDKKTYSHGGFYTIPLGEDKVYRANELYYRIKEDIKILEDSMG